MSNLLLEQMNSFNSIKKTRSLETNEIISELEQIKVTMVSNRQTKTLSFAQLCTLLERLTQYKFPF